MSSPPAISLSAALDDPELLLPSFSGASWATWRALLRAAEGLPLDPAQLDLFCTVAGRDPPSHRVRELWVVAGRRAGKDSIASAIATVAAMGDYSELLRPGERATVMCLAVDRNQAKIVHRYIAGYFTSLPLLRPLVARETDDGLELSNGVEIIVATNSYRSVRGRTIVCVIFDEVAFWRDDYSATPDFETYNAVLPGLVTLPGAMLVGISTPYRRSGLLFDRWQRFYGQPDDDVLVARGPSSLFNPTLPQRIIDQAIERDPEAAAAEWLAEWRSDLADFVTRDVVEAAVVRGRAELPPLPGAIYRAFVDPSSGSGGDRMTLAISHAAGDAAILDVLRGFGPPFAPDQVAAEMCEVLRTYGLRRVVGDRWGLGWVGARFEEQGIQYEIADKPKSDIYREFLGPLNSGKVELLDHPQLIAELLNLERRVARGGRDSIDHPRGLHDDYVNAAAGALGLVDRDHANTFMRIAAIVDRREAAEAIEREAIEVARAELARSEAAAAVLAAEQVGDSDETVWVKFTRNIGITYAPDHAFPGAVQQYMFTPGIHAVQRRAWEQHEKYLIGSGASRVNEDLH